MVRTESQSPSRSRIALAVAGARDVRVLYVASRPGSALREAAETGQVDLVATEPELVIIQGRNRLPGRAPGSAQGQNRRARWGHWAVDRVLLLAEMPMTQRALADAAGISQQAVSKILRVHPDAIAAADGWAVESAADLLDRWAQEYPGAGGIESDWYHLDPVTAQARLVVAVADSLSVDVLATGDIAADTYAPWRLPATATLYTAEWIDLSVADFVPAEPGESTLTVRIPRDPTIWPVARWYSSQSEGDGGSLADPVLAYWDLLRAPGADAAEAASMLRQKIVEGRPRG